MSYRFSDESFYRMRDGNEANLKRIADLEDDLNAAIDEVKDLEAIKAKIPDYGDGPEPYLCIPCVNKDKRIADLEATLSAAIDEVKELNARIVNAQKDLRMAALSDDCVLHLSAYLGAISHDLEGGGE